MPGDWTRQYLTGRDRNRAKPYNGYLGGTPKNFVTPVGASPVFSQLPNARQSRTEQVDLCEYTVNESDPEPKLVSVDLFTPSPRLTTTVQVFVERAGVIGGGPIVAGIYPCTVNIFALSINPTSGNVSRLQALHAFNPPYALQIQPGYKAVRVVATVEKDNWDFPEGFNGAYLRLSCAWEPNTFVEQEELQRLYAACSISTIQPVVV